MGSHLDIPWAFCLFPDHFGHEVDTGSVRTRGEFGVHCNHPLGECAACSLSSLFGLADQESKMLQASVRKEAFWKPSFAGGGFGDLEE